MSFEKQIEFAKAAKVPLQHPSFFTKIFSLIASYRKQGAAKDGDNLKRVCLEEYDEISQAIDSSKIQESCSVRNVLRSRRLANLLIQDNGEINALMIPKVIRLLKENLFSLGPERQYDGKRQQQIVSALEKLEENKELTRLLKRICKPIGHRYAEQMIRETLQLPSNTVITDAHARRAALSAWMTYLRQNVGSCFATAPAIIIHDEQPEKFLQDIYELLTTGRLKRTYGGIEYSVPLSSSWGSGDLKKTFVLPRDLDLASEQLWEAPSFVQALIAIGLIDDEKTDSEKRVKAKEWIQGILQRWEGSSSLILLTVEEILSRLLMEHLGITPKDLDDYENRPKMMLQTSLMMQIPKASAGSGGKGEACLNFYKKFELSKNTFKAFADNALLKAWEFTLASFSETKANFARWNLYSSLGLRPDDRGGIGHALFEMIKAKLDQCNAQVNDLQQQYEQMFSQIKYLEERLRRPDSETEERWLKSDYQVKTQEFYSLEEMRDAAHQKAKRLAQLFDVLIDYYDSKFPAYFQEVYDADMRDVHVGPYDDTPAGFRLLYKHGRSNTSQWTGIKNANEFIEALGAFFTATENEIASLPQLKGLSEQLSEIITSIVNHIKTQEFIETAFDRMAIAHHKPIVRNPLENLDKIEKKPWAYTSGGTMDTLVSCYYKREQKPTEVGRVIESESDLTSFFFQTLKEISPKEMNEYLEHPNQSMLIHSPTHAFLFKPGLWPFKEGWKEGVANFAGFKKAFIDPMQNFVSKMVLDPEALLYLTAKLYEQVPKDFQPHFQKTFSQFTEKMTPRGFRQFILETMAYDRGFRSIGGPVLSPEQIDSQLFASLPVFSNAELKKRLEKIFGQLSWLTSSDVKRLLDLYEQVSEARSTYYMADAQDLYSIAMSLYLMDQLHPYASQDVAAEIRLAMQKLKFSMPMPIIFADTNWVKETFGFMVNPGTEKYELWRLDYTGGKGVPMAVWKEWVDGSRRDRTWGIYTKPYEYR